MDIFAVDNYPEDKALFTKHFKDLELLLRLATWIEFIYVYSVKEGSNEGSNKVRKELVNKYDKAKDKKKFLEEMTDIFLPKQMLESWYLHHNPDKVDKDMEKSMEKLW